MTVALDEVGRTSRKGRCNLRSNRLVLFLLCYNGNRALLRIRILLGLRSFGIRNRRFGGLAIADLTVEVLWMSFLYMYVMPSGSRFPLYQRRF